MSQSFDELAVNYDAAFTNTIIGRHQRIQVWNYLKESLPGDKKLRILETNCGTGEDALFLSEMGHRVLATDISEPMIKKASEKSELPEFAVLNMLNIQSLAPGKFDLVFSNFGGLNCLSPVEMRNYIQQVAQILTKSGRFIAVVMPNFCFMETFYFLLKLRPRKAFRRLRKGSVDVRLNGSSMPIWYYSPKDMKGLAGKQFSIRKTHGIGTFIPPSYLEPLISRAPGLVALLNSLDKRFSRNRLAASISDHYLIDFELLS